jgi:PPM family protein phosphatase
VPTLVLKSTVRSDAGLVRANNEDAAFASPRVAAVADGVGGRAAGEVASRLAIYAIVHMDKCLPTEPVAVALERAVGRGNDTIAFVAGARPALAGMRADATT